MPTHKEVCCTIHTKDGVLHEYQDDDSEDQSSPSSTKTVYVEAQDGVPFWIQAEALPDYQFTIGDHVTFEVHIDGKDVGSTNVNKLCPKLLHEGVYTMEDGVAFVQPFKFSEISLGMPLRGY